MRSVGTWSRVPRPRVRGAIQILLGQWRRPILIESNSVVMKSFGKLADCPDMLAGCILPPPAIEKKCRDYFELDQPARHARHGVIGGTSGHTALRSGARGSRSPQHSCHAGIGSLHCRLL